MNTTTELSPARMRCVVSNLHRILGKRYKQSPLWSIVCDVFGYGSLASCEMLRDLGFDPRQRCNEKLKFNETPL